MRVKNFIEKLLFIILILIVLSMNFLKIGNPILIGILIIIFDFYRVVKYKDNYYLFFLFICIMYFDYSFLISKYFSTTPTLVDVYKQIAYSNTKMIGVSILLIFHLFTTLFIDENYEESNNLNDIFFVDFSKKRLIQIIILTLLIFVVLLDYFVFHFLSATRTIYEYLLIPFVFGFYYTKQTNSIFYRNVLFMLMLFSTIVNMWQGARVISLQPMIAYLFIWHGKKINWKNISIAFIFVVIVFTIFGLYGDYKDFGYDLSTLNSSVVIKTFSDRKFSLDTAISSYWTGLTYIEISNIIPFSQRILNFIEYITIYAIKGTSSSYVQLYDFSRRYYVHYYGGYISSYFYYWFGWSGIFIIGLYIGKLMNLAGRLNKDFSDFSKLLTVYFISTLPRWYLYYPVTLFRGMLIFIVFYFVFNYGLDIIYKKKG